MAEFLRPAVPGRAVPLLYHRLRQGFEQSMQVERLAALQHEALEIRGVTLVGMRLENAEEDRQRLLLQGGDVAVVDELGSADVLRSDKCILHAREARRLVDRDVERVQERAVGGEERAGALRIGEEQGVQRVDADEIGARRRSDLGEAREILEIADAPVAFGAKRVELAPDAPGAAIPQPVGKVAGRAGGRGERVERDRRRRRSEAAISSSSPAAMPIALQRGALRVIGSAHQLAVQSKVARLDADGGGEAVEVFAHRDSPITAPSRGRRLTPSPRRGRAASGP